MILRFPLPLVALCISLSSLAQTSTPQSAAPAKPTCTVDLTAPTEADKLLAGKKYPEAEAAYRVALAKASTSGDAQLGIVRALIGEDKIIEAQAYAAGMLKESPQTPFAEIATSEAAFRAGDIDESTTHAKAAYNRYPCEGRTLASLATIFSITGNYGFAARSLDAAHRYRPNDELILRDWINSLSRKARQTELNRYLNQSNSLDSDDLHEATVELGHLKTRRPGECRITSKAEAVKTPLQLIYGDSPRPEAYGLDVTFDGKRRRMQIDTGASGIVLSQSAAKGLGLVPEFHIKTGGVGDEGDIGSYLAHVHNIQIGDVQITDCMVEVLEHEKQKLDVDGLIGMDVFDRWLVTLDYPGAELRLAPLPARPGSSPVKHLDSDPLPGDIGDADDMPQDRYIAPDMRDWIWVYRFGHQIMLPARIENKKTNGQEPTHFLIIDTGASHSMLSPAMGREAGKLENTPVEFSGLSGKVKKVYRVNVQGLLAGNLRLPQAWIFVYDISQISHDNGFETSGLLGLSILQRLTIQIDYRDNLVKLHYDPKHDTQRF